MFHRLLEAVRKLLGGWNFRSLGCLLIQVMGFVVVVSFVFFCLEYSKKKLLPKAKDLKLWTSLIWKGKNLDGHHWFDSMADFGFQTDLQVKTLFRCSRARERKNTLTKLYCGLTWHFFIFIVSSMYIYAYLCISTFRKKTQSITTNFLGASLPEIKTWWCTREACG